MAEFSKLRESVIFRYNVNEDGIPISVKIENEQKQVSPLNNTVQLEQIPDPELDIVVLKNGVRMPQVDNEDEITDNTYYVDYSKGLIKFTKANAGKTTIINYYGKGVELISASRVYDEKSLSNNDVVKTLQEIIDIGKEYIEILGNVIATKKELEEMINISTDLKNKLDSLNQEAIQNNKNLKDTNTVATKTNEVLKQTISEAQDDINTINATGNKSLIIGASQFINNEYTWNHNMNSENLTVNIIDVPTKEPLNPDYKIVDKNNILIRNSAEHPNVKVILSASYYQGNSLFGTNVEEFADDSVGINEKSVRLKDDNGTYQNPVTNSDSVFMADGKTKLTKKVDDISAQLEHNTNKLEGLNNSTELLKIYNAYNNFQNIHPKVLYFESAWNGYKFWMAYTPYPGGNTAYENPSIAVSNDGYNWSVPSGLVNPIVEFSGDKLIYNSDTHLVYRADLNRLEVWWRLANETEKTHTIKRKISTNGITWSDEETLFTGGMSGEDNLSPAILHENSKYKMFTVTNGSVKNILYRESTDGVVWSSPTILNIPYNGVTPWHLDVINDGGKYIFILQGWENGLGNNKSCLYCFESIDLNNFTEVKKILSPSNVMNKFDSEGIYRSSLVKVNDLYYLYYSGVGTKNSGTNRGISLMRGYTPYTLKGISFSFADMFTKFNDWLVFNSEYANLEIEFLKLLNRGVGSVGLKARGDNSILQVVKDTDKTTLGKLEIKHLYLEKDPDGTMVQEGGLKYVSTERDGKAIQFYDGSNFHTLSEKYLLDLCYVQKGASSSLTLSDGVVNSVPFTSRIKDFPQKWTNNNTFTARNEGWYNIDISFQIQDVATQNNIKVFANINDNGITEATTLYEVQGTSGIITISTKYFIFLNKNDTFKIGIISTGTNSPVVRSTRGYLKIDKQYNTIL